MSEARAAVLAHIRAALGPAPAVPDVPRGYRPAGALAPDVDLFCERVADYRATVHRVSADELDATVRDLCPGRVAVPREPPCGLDGIDAVRDEPPLAVEVLDGIETVLTGRALTVAETGTVVLDGGPRSGRRALTLVPDHHVCVVHAGQVVAGVPDAIAALPPRAPLTWVSGPSTTSDIEPERVEGVHGPHRLEVVVVG